MFACLHGPGNLKALAAEFSPIVELTAADTVTFDISGLDRLFGLPQEIAAAILRRAGERLWGGPPGPRPAPWPACRKCRTLDSSGEERVQGDPRGPGGSPRHLCRCSTEVNPSRTFISEIEPQQQGHRAG
jgi:hypothetical protein